MTRIALVTNQAAADLLGDGPPLLAALEAIGMAAEIVPWGPGPDWAGYDAVVVRNTWDYVLNRDLFLAWADEVATKTRLANPAPALRWNTDKRYLRELAGAGVPTVPTLWVEPGGTAPPVDWDDFVVKPSVSAGARLSARYRRGDDPTEHIGRIHAAGAAAMLQPYLASVDNRGETGTYVFGGNVSHAITKGPVLVPGQMALSDFSAASVQDVRPAEPDTKLGAFAMGVVREAPPGLLYARIDTAPGPDGEPLLLELEATEPYLFLEDTPAAAGRFARALERWLL